MSRFIFTGVSGAFGCAVVSDLVDCGHAVADLDLVPARADCDATATFPGGSSADKAKVARTVADAVAAFRGRDSLVSIAGGFAWEPV